MILGVALGIALWLAIVAAASGHWLSAVFALAAFIALLRLATWPEQAR